MQFTPLQVRAMAHSLEGDMDYIAAAGPEDDDPPVFMTGIHGPFEKLNPAALVIKAIDVLHMLVSVEPVPEGGHTALEEAILYGLLTSTIKMARDDERTSSKKWFKDVNLDSINALLKAADMKPVKTLKNFSDDDIEELADALFFWDRDWEYYDDELPEEALAELGINESYYSAMLRVPDRVDFEVAEEMLQELISMSDAKKSKVA